MFVVTESSISSASKTTTPVCPLTDVTGAGGTSATKLDSVVFFVLLESLASAINIWSGPAGVAAVAESISKEIVLSAVRSPPP